MAGIVLFDTDCTVCDPSTKELRPGMLEWMQRLAGEGYDVRMWSAAGAKHAKLVARRFNLPVRLTHSKGEYVSGGPQLPPCAPPLYAHEHVVLTVDDDATEFLPGVEHITVPAFLGKAHVYPTRKHGLMAMEG